MDCCSFCIVGGMKQCRLGALIQPTSGVADAASCSHVMLDGKHEELPDERGRPSGKIRKEVWLWPRRKQGCYGRKACERARRWQEGVRRYCYPFLTRSCREIS